MTSKTQNITLDSWFADTAGGAGNGNGTRMTVGMGTGDWAFKNRFAISIPRGNLFDGVPSAASITEFNIRLKTNSANTGIGGSVHFYLERGTTAFTEKTVVAGQGGVPAGANINAYVTSDGPASGEWPGPTRTATDRAEFSGSPSADTYIKVNALALGRWWFAHPEVTALVLVAVAADETVTAQRCTFWTQNSTSKPYAELVYGGNSPPNKPTSVTVVTSGSAFTISATHTDPDGDASPRFEVVFEPD